jgi:3-methyladenine DNA glycosylase AlkC
MIFGLEHCHVTMDILESCVRTYFSHFCSRFSQNHILKEDSSVKQSSTPQTINEKENIWGYRFGSGNTMFA